MSDEGMPRSGRGPGPGQRPERRSLVVRLIEAKARRPFAETIRQRRKEGKTYRQIGAEFGVSWMTVWRHYHQEEKSRERLPTP